MDITNNPIIIPEDFTDEKLYLCNLCSTTPDIAKRECLACQAYCCESCGEAHAQNPRFSHHKIIDLQSRELCAKHNQEMIIYCITDRRLCCMACAQFSMDHKGHEMLDIGSALESMQSEIRQVEGQLEEMEENAHQKVEVLERQRVELDAQAVDMVNKVKTRFEEIMKVMETEVKKQVESIEQLRDQRILKIDFELQKTTDIIFQISQLHKPDSLKTQLTDYFPRAKDLTALPIHEPDQFTFDEGDRFSSQQLLNRLSCSLDAWYYTDLTLEARWQCRSCGSKNFPKEPTCRSCNLHNFFLEKLQCPSVKLPQKRVRARRT